MEALWSHPPPALSSPFPSVGRRCYLGVRQLSGTQYCDYSLVNILISPSPAGFIPWLRLRHAQVLTSWGSIRRDESDVNWEKKTPNLVMVFVPLIFLTHVGKQKPCQTSVCCVILPQPPLSAFITYLRHLPHIYFVKFWLPQCREHHGGHQGPHQVGQILGRFNCAQVCTVKSQPKYWHKAVLCG